MRISRALLILLAPFSLSSAASAQVLITEVQSDPLSQPDDEEWVELQNTGTASVTLDGWTINDFVGANDPANESATRWTFPPGSMIGAGEVIVIARQALLFNTSLGEIASWELADGNDDPNVPNLTAVGGTDPIQLSNQATGDAVVLRDDQGALVSYVEWGTFDRNPPGTPFTADPPQGSSLIRVQITGSSSVDFAIAMTPTPFVGFMSSQTLIVGTTVEPRHVVFGTQYRVSTMVTDSDGLNAVDIFFATATSSAGNAAENYVPITMTSSGSTYTFQDQVQNLGGGFTEPATFHDRYIRFFILAEDNNNEVTTEPPNADESASNPNYLPAFVQNVVPNAPAPIAEAREPVAEDVPLWSGHSVRVQGIALIGPRVMGAPTNTLFSIQDATGAILFFSTSTVTPAFDAGDELILTGEINNFRGATQLIDGAIEVTGNTGPIPETTLTIAEIDANGEQYEAQLVKIDGVDFTEARATWPDNDMMPGSWNVTVTDGANEIVLRVTPGADIFGQAAPQYGFDVRGVLNERDGAWQIFPRGAEDITANPMPPQMDGGVTGMDGSTNNNDGGTGGPDGGTGTDTGTGTEPDEGCDCTAADASQGSVFGLLLLALLVLVRKRRI